MRAVELVRTRISLSETVFAEFVPWRVAKPVTGSTHGLEYRLAYMVDGVRVPRYDNEAGNGDHRRFGKRESPYAFETVEKLVADFRRDCGKIFLVALDHALVAWLGVPERRLVTRVADRAVAAWVACSRRMASCGCTAAGLLRMPACAA